MSLLELEREAQLLLSAIPNDSESQQDRQIVSSLAEIIERIKSLGPWEGDGLVDESIEIVRNDLREVRRRMEVAGVRFSDGTPVPYAREAAPSAVLVEEE